MKVVLSGVVAGLTLLFLFCGSAAARPDEPVRTTTPRPTITPQTVIPVIPTTQNLNPTIFDPSRCHSGYILRGGMVGKDMYLVWDCLDDENVETQS